METTTSAGSIGSSSMGQAPGGVEEGGGEGESSGLDGPPKYDVLAVPDAPETGGNQCPGGAGSEGFDFSLIWIANSPQGTVSKIDTVNAVEVARYATGPGAPDPSRTSVSLVGDVAVLNRAGSVTKIAADIDDCVDSNNDGTIQTSSGPDDVLAWGTDECVLWHTQLDYTGGGGPRSIAWDAGETVGSCSGVDAGLWVGFRNQPDLGQIRRLNGSTGLVEESVTIEGWLQVYGQGLYGGAFDGEGQFWVIGKGGTLLRLQTEDLSYEQWEQPPPEGSVETFYGLAVAADGAPWIVGQSGHLYRFDPQLETFEVVASLELGYRGMAIDEDGFAWMAYRPNGNNPTCGVTKFDINARTHVADIEFDDCLSPVGVSVDVEGFVWVVDMEADHAYKIHPTEFTSVVVDGLVSPYTYSDMTGAGLNLVVNPPAG